MSRVEEPSPREAYLTGLVVSALTTQRVPGFRFRPVTVAGVFVSEIEILDDTDALVGKVLVREAVHLR